MMWVSFENESIHNRREILWLSSEKFIVFDASALLPFLGLELRAAELRTLFAGALKLLPYIHGNFPSVAPEENKRFGFLWWGQASKETNGSTGLG
jgi:hypothetical protein